MTNVVIVGGAGQFGRRIAARLAPTKDLRVIIAGRNLARAQQTANELAHSASSPIPAVKIDSHTVTADQLTKHAPDIIINASGPFQDDNYALVEAAIATGSHYIDLADARQFVLGISQFDARAKDASVLVASGASTVPGLSSVVIGHLAADLQRVERVEIGLSPGNHYDPGLATTQSVLMGLGKPIATRRDGRDTTVYGWQDINRQRIGTLGKRWLANVDVPDLALIPLHYPDVSSVSFQAGTELSIQHLGLWALSWLSRTGVMRHPERWAEVLLTLKSYTQSLGSDCGGMRIMVTGRDQNGRQIEKLWTLVARDDHGPFVPTLASTILVKSLSDGRLQHVGAQPCFDLFPYQAIAQEAADLSVTCTIDQAMR